MKTTRLIGCKCKYGDIFSLAILIGRGLDQVLSWFEKSCFLFNVKFDDLLASHFENVYVLQQSVLLAMRIHLFPFRTQKLSSSVSKILGG